MTSTANRYFDPVELERLACLACEDQLTAEDNAALEAILRESSDARRFYLEYIDQHSNLLSEFGTEAVSLERLADSRQRAEGRGQGAVSTEPKSSLSTQHVSRKSLLNWASRHPKGPAIAIAVAVMVMIVGAMAITPVSKWIAGEKDAESAEDAEHVAILNDWRDAKWLERTRPPLNNPRLFVGKRLVLESGFIEVKYNTGAIVVIEGPAEFIVGGRPEAAGGSQSGKREAESGKNLANSGYLRLGNLVARVEGKDAQGFTIDTPSARVEDLGTEFGVEVQKDGAAEFVVLSGEVDVVRNRDDGLQQRVRLMKDEAAFVAPKSKAITRRKQIDPRWVALMRSRLQAIRVESETGVARNANAVSLTSVDQLDLKNVVKAYDFTGTTSVTNEGVSLVIGGVAFTRHWWQDGLTTDDLTLTNDFHPTADNQASGAPSITQGGTATDQKNLSTLLDWWNIGHGGDVDLSIAVPNGTYKIQYIVGVSGTRDNELFDITAGAPGVSLGAFSSAGVSQNFLITGETLVTDGEIRLRLADNAAVSGGDSRRLISGLIINSIPTPPMAEPGTAVRSDQQQDIKPEARTSKSETEENTKESK